MSKTSTKRVKKSTQKQAKNLSEAKELYAIASQKQAKNLSEAKELYATANGNEIAATESIVKLTKELKKLETLKKQLVYKEEAVKLQVMNYMQDHSCLKSGDLILATWKNTTRNIFDLAAFKEAYPSLYHSFLTETSSRVFRLG